jgi:hypothetical protein
VDGRPSVVGRKREDAFEAGDPLLLLCDFAAGSAEPRHPAVEARPLLVEPGGLTLEMTVPADIHLINGRSRPQQAATGRRHGCSSRVSVCVVD